MYIASYLILTTHSTITVAELFATKEKLLIMTFGPLRSKTKQKKQEQSCQPADFLNHHAI